MKNSSITIQRGRSFKKFFSSNLLEHTTVFASFGMLKNDGSFLKRGQFETRVQEDGYFLSMNETETLKLKRNSTIRRFSRKSGSKLARRKKRDL